MSYIYLSEYNGLDRTAQVFRKDGTTMFVVKCFIMGRELRQTPFQSESEADDYAEDWVLTSTSE